MSATTKRVTFKEPKSSSMAIPPRPSSTSAKLAGQPQPQGIKTKALPKVPQPRSPHPLSPSSPMKSSPLSSSSSSMIAAVAMKSQRSERDERKPRSHNISKSIPEIGKPQALKATSSPLHAQRASVLESRSKPKPLSVPSTASSSAQGRGHVVRISSPRPGGSPSSSSPMARTVHEHMRPRTPPPPPPPGFSVEDLEITRRSVVGDELNDSAEKPKSKDSFCLFIVVSSDPTIDVKFWLVMPYGKSGDKDPKLSSEAQLRSSRGRDMRYATYIWNGDRAPTIMPSLKYNQGFFAASRFYVASAFEVDFESEVRAEEELKAELKKAIATAREVPKLAEKLEVVLKVIRQGYKVKQVEQQIKNGMKLLMARKQRETSDE